MSIPTFDQLRASAGPIAEGQVKVAKALTGKNIFLSHSSSDNEHLEHAVAFLERQGGRVYDDVRDDAITGKEESAIAVRLREAIHRCERLVVLATSNTSSSRWIPWELGVADGRRGRERAALWPIRPQLTSPEAWAQQGYFQIYPRVDLRIDEMGRHHWRVLDPADGKYWTLEKWLALA